MPSCNSKASTSPQPLRVFIVEDSSLIREKLEEMLASMEGVDNAGYATGANDAIREILLTHPDAVVLDIRLAQGNGFDVLRTVRSQAPDIPIYILSNLVISPYRRLANQLGATDFFDKSRDFWKIRDALLMRIRTNLNQPTTGGARDYRHA